MLPSPGTLSGYGICAWSSMRDGKLKIALGAAVLLLTPLLVWAAAQHVHAPDEGAYTAPGLAPMARDAARDDLKRISGIGPKLESQLNKLGIFHFEQIGRFERNDILWVAHHLKSFPGRIVRDRWIEQAQTLANQRRD